MAYPTSSLADFGSVFLPKPAIHFTGRNIKRNGAFDGLSFR